MESISDRYDPQAIELKWQQIWEEQGCFHSEMDADRPKYYVLEMFPYPSGRIHIGHARVYSIGDAVARLKRMQGFNVLHPMGWLGCLWAARGKRGHQAWGPSGQMDHGKH